MGSVVRKRKYRIVMLVAASCLFFAPETWSERPSQQGEFRSYQTKFQTLKTEFQQLDSGINSKLTEKQRTRLNRKLQPQMEDLYRSLKRLERYSLKLGIPREKLSKTSHLPPPGRMDGTTALLEAAIDYTATLAMQSQQVKGTKDEDTIGAILQTLEEMEQSLRKMKSGKLNSLLEDKIGEKDDD